MSGLGFTSISTLVFEDRFDRVDSELVGNGWIEVVETPPEDPDFLGYSLTAINNGALVFDIGTDGNSPSVSRFRQLYLDNELSQDLAEDGFLVEFSITPDGPERIRHFVGLADRSREPVATVQQEGNLLIPGAGIGIEIVRSDFRISNSGFRIWRFEGDADFQYEGTPDTIGEELVALGRTSFQFEAGVPVHVTLAMDAAGGWGLTLSDGTTTDSFRGRDDPLDMTLDQAVLSTIEAGHTRVALDNFRVSSLAPGTSVEPPQGIAPVVSGATFVDLDVFGTEGGFTRVTGDQLVVDATDADGDLSFVRFSDSTPGDDGGTLTLDGVPIDANYVDVVLADLDRVAYEAGPNEGSNQIAVEAFDAAGNRSNDLIITMNVTAAPPEPGSAPIITPRLSDLSFITGLRVSLSELFDVDDADGDLVSFQVSTSAQVRLTNIATGETSELGALFDIASDSIDQYQLVMPAAPVSALGIELTATDADDLTDSARVLASVTFEQNDYPILLDLDGMIYNLGDLRDGLPDDEGPISPLDFEPFNVITGEVVTDPTQKAELFRYAEGFNLARRLIDRGGIGQADEVLLDLLDQIEDFYQIEFAGDAAVSTAALLAAALVFPPLTLPAAALAGASYLAGLAVSALESSSNIDRDTAEGGAYITLGKVTYDGAAPLIGIIDAAITNGQPVSANTIRVATEDILAAQYLYTAGGALLRESPALESPSAGETLTEFSQLLATGIEPLVPAIGPLGGTATLVKFAEFTETAGSLLLATRSIVEAGRRAIDVLREENLPVPPEVDFFSDSRLAETAALFASLDVLTASNDIGEVTPDAPSIIATEALDVIRIRNDAGTFEAVTIENYSSQNILIDAAGGGISSIDPEEGSIVLNLQFIDPAVSPLSIRLEGAVSGLLHMQPFGTSTVLGFEAAASGVLEGTDDPDVLVVDDTMSVVRPGAGGDAIFAEGLPIIIEGGPDDVAGDILFGVTDSLRYNLEGGEEADSMSGGAGDDSLDGGPGDDTLMGSGGSDLISGDAGSDSLDGGDDHDRLLGANGFDILVGGSGNDSLEGNFGNDTLSGDDGNDSLFGGLGFDSLIGGADDDFLQARNGFDTLEGGAGNDSLEGNNGNDMLFGGEGNDTLEGGLGFDALSGGAGNDFLRARDGFDTLDGGAGDDSLQGNNGNDSLSGGLGDDRIEGGLGSDSMAGGAGNDTLLGANGFDRLGGNAGDDLLEGNAGNDTMDGGLGNDTMRGGLGADAFVFAFGADRITDFQNTIDSVEIAAGLLSGTDPVADDLRDYASLDAAGNLILDFGGGNTLTFEGISRVNAILDDVSFV